MNPQSPLPPLGRLPNSGKPYTNLAVISIVALHVIFFTGLLFQGCRRPKTETAHTPDQGLLPPPATNAAHPADAFAGLVPPYGASVTAAPPTTPGGAAPTDPLARVDAGATLPTNLWVGAPQQPTNFAAIPEPLVAPPPRHGETEHKIAPGDTPARIAKKYGISLDQLREANPSMDDRRLRIGQTLRIPTPHARESAVLAPGTTETPGTTTEAPATIHVVKPGETLTRIAARYGTTVKELRQFNNLRTDRILVDQKLKIPPARTNSAGSGGTNN